MLNFALSLINRFEICDHKVLSLNLVICVLPRPNRFKPIIGSNKTKQMLTFIMLPIIIVKNWKEYTHYNCTVCKITEFTHIKVIRIL